MDKAKITLLVLPFKSSLQTNLCPLSGDYNRTYWCNMGFGSTTALYRQHYRYYYFILTSTNDLGVLTENFTIDNHGIGKFHISIDWSLSFSEMFSLVIPDPVESLNATKITTDSAVIEWKIPYQLKTFPRGKLNSQQCSSNRTRT